MRIRLPQWGQVRLTSPVPKIVSIFDMFALMPCDPAAACDGNHQVDALQSAVCDLLSGDRPVGTPCLRCTDTASRTKKFRKSLILLVSPDGIEPSTY
jgi:hypothetical protein